MYFFKRIFIFIIVVLLLSFNSSFAHNKIIKGQIISKDSLLISGATIKIIGTVLGSISDKNGKFIIKGIPDGKYIIQISAIGYETIRKEIILEHQTNDELILDFIIIENPIKTNDIVVTANRDEKLYEDIPIKVSTMSPEQFNITSSNNLREALQFQPSVRTEVNCQNCGFSQVRINGLDGKYSQILINSKPIFSTLNGVYGLEQIPTSILDRVEVIRGGGSSLYGGNAIAGVINIITKDPVQNSFNISYSTIFIDNSIMDNTININSSIINDSRNFGFTFFSMLNKRNDYDANNDSFSEIGRLDVNTLGSKLFWKLDSKNKLSFEFLKLYHNIRGGNKLDMQPHESDITEFAENNTYSGQINFQSYINSNAKIDIYMALQNTLRQSYYGSNQDLNAYGKTNNTTLVAGASYSFFDDLYSGNHNLILGIDFNKDLIDDKMPSYNREINQTTETIGLFVQDDWKISNFLDFLFGIRVEKHNLNKNLILNPRASSLVKLYNNLNWRLTYSTGYRAPQAFDEDLHITQVGGEAIIIILDENLKTEYSNSLSTSLDYFFDIFDMTFSVSTELFYTKLSDVFVLEDIGLDINNNRILLRKNSDNSIVKGLTFEIQTRKDFFNLRLSLTYQSSLYSNEIEWSKEQYNDNIISQKSNAIFRSPNLYGYIISTIDINNNIELDLSAYYTGSMKIPHYKGYIEKDKLVETDDFLDINAKLSYIFDMEPNIKISLGLINILNSYQNDFDKGIDRDAGYMFGPFRPFSTSFSVSLNF